MCTGRVVGGGRRHGLELQRSGEKVERFLGLAPTFEVAAAIVEGERNETLPDGLGCPGHAWLKE
jgi:hypothetical protein